MGLLSLIGAANSFIMTTSVEGESAAIIVRVLRHGVVWGSMVFGWFGHPSCAVEGF